MKLYTIALKNLRNGKGVIFMISLAVMLISVVANLGIIINSYLAETMMRNMGDYHVTYFGLDDRQVDVLKSREEAENVSVIQSLSISGAVEEKENGISISYAPVFGDSITLKITSGNAPAAENEVVFAPHVAEYLGIKAKIGEEFDLTLYNHDGTEGYTYRFKVSGFLRRESYTEYCQMYVSEEFAKRFEHISSAQVRFKEEGYDYYNLSDLFAEAADIPKNNMFINEAYTRYNYANPDAAAFIAIMLSVLCLTGALVIYNAYNLSIVKRIHQYGLLIIIGASKRQVRRCIYLEALFSAFAALPFGLLLGTLAGAGGLELMKGFANIGSEMSYELSLPAYLLAVFISVVMVLLGVFRPARKAAKITPVEAVKFSGEQGKIKPHRELGQVTLKSLAKLNMSRAKGRTVGTILSLAISGVLLLSVSAVAFSMYDSAEDFVRENVPFGDIVINAGIFSKNAAADPFSREMAEELRNTDGVKKLDLFTAQWFVEFSAPQTGEKVEIITFDPFPVKGLSSEHLQTLIDELGDGYENITLDDFKDSRNVIAVIQPFQERYSGDKLDAYKAGNTLKCSEFNDIMSVSEEMQELKIIGVIYSDSIERAYSDTVGVMPTLFTLSDGFADAGWKTDYSRAVLTVEPEKHDAVYAKVESLCAGNDELEYYSFKVKADEYRSMIMSFVEVVMLVLAVIILIGIMNMAGSIFMGVEQRKRELGILIAVGLSRKGAEKLLKSEGYRVSLICTTISCALGFPLGLLLIKLLVDTGAKWLHFSFPIVPVIGFCVVYVAVPFLLTQAAVRRMRKNTVTEMLGRQI